MVRIGYMVVVLSLVSSAAGAAPGSGIDVQWRDCVGGANAVSDVQFNCTGAASQTHRLIFNFKIPQNLPRFSALTASVKLESETLGPLAPFWHYETGGCQRMGGGNPDGVALSLAMPTSANCVENFASPWGADGSNGIGAIANYAPDSPSPGRGTFLIGVAGPPGLVPLEAGVNYFALSLAFDTDNRFDCGGCQQQVGLTWTQAILESDDGSSPVTLFGADKGQTCGSINGGVSICVCSCTAALNRTWGNLKALYR